MSLGEGFIDLKLGTSQLDAGLKSIAPRFVAVGRSISTAMTGAGEAVAGVGKTAAAGLNEAKVAGEAVASGLVGAGEAGREAAAGIAEVGGAGREASSGLEQASDAGQTAADALSDTGEAGRSVAAALSEASGAGQEAAVGLTAAGASGAGAAAGLVKAERAGRSASGVLAQLFGGRGGGLAGLFGGGMIIAGISRVARELAALAEKGHELADAFRSGAMTADDVGLNLAKSLPIVGNLVKAAIDLAEVLAPIGGDFSKSLGVASDLATQAKREHDLAAATTDIEHQKVVEAQRYKDALDDIVKKEREGIETAKKEQVIPAEPKPLSSFVATPREIQTDLREKREAYIAELETQAGVEKQIHHGARQAEKAAEETHQKNLTEIKAKEAKEISDTADRMQRAADEASAAAEKREKDAADATATKWKSIRDRIKALGDEVKTPLEVYQDAMKELSGLKGLGLSVETFARQAEKLKGRLEGTKMPAVDINEVVGGRLGLEEIAKNIQVAQLRSTKDERQLAAAEETARQTKETNEHLKRMAESNPFTGWPRAGPGLSVFSGPA